jgi:squalene cyclase
MRPPITSLLLAATLLLAPLGAQESPGVRDAIAKLQPEIDLAIDQGVAWLIENQLRDGSWAYHTTQYPTGQTALSVYTLLKSGLPTSHPAVARGLHFLKGHRASRPTPPRSR